MWEFNHGKEIIETQCPYCKMKIIIINEVIDGGEDIIMEVKKCQS